MNPILPRQYFIPNTEARQWQDGRMYIYGTVDISGNMRFSSHQYQVFSSDDLIHWTDHGISFDSQGINGNNGDVPWSNHRLYAPDCICKDGKYYLYFCMADNSEGVAVSDRPQGPFKNATPVQGAHMDAIDPAALVDDDGKVYFYWGQFNAKGARLNDDLASIDTTTLNTSILNEKEHGFHEGASIRKRNDIYYLVFADTSRGKASSLGYAMSEFPLGPFEKRGIIIDNNGCNPQNWNNHGSIAEFNGKWYVFYHRSNQGTMFNRRVCVEPIFFNEDGTINEVEMTTQGITGPMDPTTKIGAYRACLLSGHVHTTVIEEESIFEESDDCLTSITNGDWAAYKYFDFSKPVKTFEIEAATPNVGGSVEVRLDSPEGAVMGVCVIDQTGGWKRWQTFSCDVDITSGVHACYLVFKGDVGRVFNIRSFRFI
jgi:arabinoxylan arabinofuranohydrolase